MDSNGEFDENCNVDWTNINLTSQIVYFVLFIVGILVNYTFLYDILYFSKIDIVTNTYIINMTIADLCFLCSIPFLIITLNLHSWVLGKIMCKLFAVSVNQFANSIFMIIKVVNCYFAECRPNLISKMCMSTGLKIDYVTWFINLLFMLPVLLYADIEYLNDVTRCSILWPSNDMKIAYIIYTFVFGFLLPFTLALIFNCLSIRSLKKKDTSKISKKEKYLNKKFVCQIVSTMILFVLRRLSFWITVLALMLIPAEQCQTKTSLICIFLVSCFIYITSFLNPILYMLFNNHNFKRSYLKTLICMTRTKNTLQENSVISECDEDNANEDRETSV